MPYQFWKKSPKIQIQYINKNNKNNNSRIQQIIDQEQLEDIQTKQFIQLLKRNGDIFGEKVTEMGRTDLVPHYTDDRFSPAQKEA